MSEEVVDFAIAVASIGLTVAPVPARQENHRLPARAGEYAAANAQIGAGATCGGSAEQPPGSADVLPPRAGAS